MKRSIATLSTLFVLFVSSSALGQTAPKAPTLSETLQWLSGASANESRDGNTHITFESKGRDSCAVIITEIRVKVGPDFWIKESFSLADIDPADIQVEKLGQGEFKKLFQGQSSVRFHTVNYSKKIIHTSNSLSQEIPTSDYILFTNDWFAPRFAKALKRAAELWGASRRVIKPATGIHCSELAKRLSKGLTGKDCWEFCAPRSKR